MGLHLLGVEIVAADDRFDHALDGLLHKRTLFHHMPEQQGRQGDNSLKAGLLGERQERLRAPLTDKYTGETLGTGQTKQESCVSMEGVWMEFS